MFESYESHFFDAETYKEDALDDVIDSFLSYNNVSAKSKEPEHILIQNIFNWLHINLIKNNFQLSTQHDITPTSSMFKKTYCSPFPASNMKLWSEPVAIDTVCSGTTAIEDVSTCAQLF